MKPVLIVSQFYWPEEIGSAPYVTELAEWLAERGREVTVLTARPHYPEYAVRDGFRGGQRDDSRRNGVRILRLPTPRRIRSGAIGRIKLESLLAARTAARIVRRQLPRHDHVVSLCPSVLLVSAAGLAKRRGGTHIALIHDIQSGLAEGLGMVRSKLIQRVMVATERAILNRTTRLAVLSEAMRQRLIDQGVRRPIDVVPIWVDTESIRPLPRASDLETTVLYTGNLGRKQGLDQVLRAAGVLAHAAPEIRLVIRGQGARRSALEAEARRMELTNVEFRELVPADELNACLADADLHLVPQAPDGADFAVPSKAYGIMAAGRPFVATAGPTSPLGHLQRASGAFHLVPPDDEHALADAIMRLARSPEERRQLGNSGRAYVVEHVSRNAVLSRFATLLGIRGAA